MALATSENAVISGEMKNVFVGVLFFVHGA